MRLLINSKLSYIQACAVLFFGCLFILLICPLSFSFARTINPLIIQDLSSITGYIVKAQSLDTYIIDLDAQDGIMTGDLFSVITEKESLTHPITENIIGKLDDVKAILRVTQIKKGYTFSTVVKMITAGVIHPGDTVKRYNQIQTKFIDQTGNGKQLYTLLLKQLPHFAWQPYLKIIPTDNSIPKKNNITQLNLFFHQKGLEIKDSDNRLIHYYPHTELYIRQSPMEGSSNLIYSDPSFEMSDAFQSYPSFQALGDIDEFVQTADFIVNEDQLFMAAADHKRISIFHIANHYITKVAETPVPMQHHPVYLNWWRPNTISKPHLTVTFWNNQDIESKIYVFHEKSLSTLAYGINYHLASYDTNYDGNPETLLGQSMDRETFWNNRTYRLLYFNRALRLSRRFRTPGSFTVYGSILGDMTGDGYLETIWVRNGILRIYQGKSFLYKTYVGDFPTQRVSYDIDPVAKKTLFRDVSIYPKPVFYDLNNDHHPELFVIHSERPFLSQIGFSSQAVRTWIKCIRYHNKMFYSQRVSRVFDSNIQAATIYNNDFIILLGITDRDADNQNHTSVIRWPVNKE
ncbi:MAG: hypothetical protein HQK75_20040 [Candidatus Magnetomorum sp.]|nr:hypothetical protein [Candidatus Magnetomorum sp.]